MSTGSLPKLPPHMTPDDLTQLVSARHAEPFSVLGLHRSQKQCWLVVLAPAAMTVTAVFKRKSVLLEPLADGVFAGQVPASKFTYTIRETYADGTIWEHEDPYRFASRFGELDQYLLGEGRHRQLWHLLGAHLCAMDDVAGVHFAIWAPNAHRVSVVGDFNFWNGTQYPMRRVGHTGIWELFIPGLTAGATYKYELLDAQFNVVQKADPVGFGAQHPPATASIVRALSGYAWHDDAWMQQRAKHNRWDQPISIYEVHLGSWRRRWDASGQPLSYRELATELVNYAVDMGFTHLELLPISEFPFDGSWGYQPVGLYAPTSRFGDLDDFRALVDAAHQAGIGVILDWVPGHFPADLHGLAHFDGTHLYEHADPREGFHQDWNTLIYNYGRNEVRNFLTANALYWLKEFHLDGLRVDAVASMLYRDYSRQDGQWIPNHLGGRENLEAIAFLQEMNSVAYHEVSGIMTIAEESTAYGGVSRPVDHGGLGFGFKWNMGWMNDTLRYMEKDPIYRSFDHHLLTFPIDWAWSENFILPISHDEVVHGKGSMLEKMPGSEGDKFAHLRAYYGYMWTFPGKKLLFMGCEIAQYGEWNHDASVDWDALAGPQHSGVQALVRDLNRLYRNTPALHRLDAQPAGFEWLANDPAISKLVFVRYGQPEDAPVLVVCHFTPVERPEIAIGVPVAGHWEEVLNTDSVLYGGGNRGNLGGCMSVAEPCDGMAQHIKVTLPPLSTMVFRLKQ